MLALASNIKALQKFSSLLTDNTLYFAMFRHNIPTNCDHMAKKARLFIPLALLTLVSSTFANATSTKICAIYPHLKDSYWLSVNYGMVKESEKQGLQLKVLESGGYPNVNRQKQQIEQCAKWKADAIILGTVSPNAYINDLGSYSQGIPVFATVNHLIVNNEQKQYLKGVVGVDWYWMGFKAGKYLAHKHPKGSGKVNVALLAGPQHSGGTKPVIAGFHEAIKNSDVIITQTKWADNDKELQRNLVQEVIESNQVSYIVGSAVAIEAAISEIRVANQQQNIGLVSTYLSHGVYRGLIRNKVEFATSDKMVLQGQLSVLQASHYLNNQPYQYDEAPKIEVLTPSNIDQNIISQSLSPSGYRPTFSVSPD
jgi:protein TorT